jgi:hypothetical protein
MKFCKKIAARRRLHAGNTAKKRWGLIELLLLLVENFTICEKNSIGRIHVCPAKRFMLI